MLMIRLAKRTAKRALRPVLNPWIARGRLVADLQQSGVRRGGILLVHSSLSSLGYVRGGAKTVIQALVDVLGPDGTLVFPTHSFHQMNAGCRTLDAMRTESCVGVLTETFRKLPGVCRSLHPTHSVAALGPRALELVQGHGSSSTPCGSGTPYARLLDNDGQVLLLGVGLKNLTAFHTVEAIANVRYLLNREAEKFTLIDAQGRSQVVSIYRHKPRVPRRFPDIEEFLTTEGALKRVRVGAASSILVEGRAFRDCMLARLREDPTFLLARCKEARSDNSQL